MGDMNHSSLLHFFQKLAEMRFGLEGTDFPFHTKRIILSDWFINQSVIFYPDVPLNPD